MASKLDYALALAARGFKVFPITPGAKAPPLVPQWPERATTDPHVIGDWWLTVPDANIGIHCEGLAVVDVDIHKGGSESLKRLDDMLGFPNTLTHGTPTGGLHALYKLPDGHPGVPNSVATLGAGLDIRSTGGYIVAPGSQVGAIANPYHVAVDVPIAPAPDWLVRNLGTVTRRERQEESNIEDAPKEAVERAREWLAGAERSVKGLGGDQTAYRVACALRDMGLSYVQACEEMRGEAWDYGCGWREGRLEEKPIRSAYKYAQNEPGVKLVTASQFTATPATAAMPLPKQKERSRVQSAETLADEPLSYDYIVKNWLERATYALMFGESGEGKTFTALDFGFHVATGREWRGNKVRQGHVLYLAFEGKGGIKRRVRALRKHYRGSLGDLWIAGVSMNLRETAGRQELAALLADLPQKPALIVIDTFARALMGGDENSAQDTGAFNNAVEALIDATGACVLVIHHSGKNKAAGARGSSAIRAALDTELEIENKQIISRKQRDAENPAALGFKLRPVEIGMDADGQLMTSCVVEASDITAGVSRPLSGRGEHAFSVLCEMVGPENTPVAQARYVAKLQDEGFARSSANAWVRKLKGMGKVTVENHSVSRRLA